MIGIVLIKTIDTYVLFDSGSTHSFVSPQLTSRLGMEPRKMETPLVVSTPLRRSWVTDVYYPACGVMIEGHQLPTNLILQEMVDFDAILGRMFLGSTTQIC